MKKLMFLSFSFILSSLLISFTFSTTVSEEYSDLEFGACLSYITVNSPTEGGDIIVDVYVNGVNVLTATSTGTYYFSVCNGDQVRVEGTPEFSGAVPVDYLIGTTFGSGNLDWPFDSFTENVPTDTTCDCGSGS